MGSEMCIRDSSKTAQSNRAAGQAKKPSSGSSSSSNPQRIKITEEEKARRKAIRGKCYRCASGDHMIPGCKVPGIVVCKSCNNQGHITPACLKTSSAWASAADSSADSGQLQLQYHPSSPAASSFYMPQPYQQFNQPTPDLPL